MITTSAPAKSILFGEHLVVYNGLGIATTVDKNCTVKTGYNNEGNVLINSKGLGLEEYLSRDELFGVFKWL